VDSSFFRHFLVKIVHTASVALILLVISANASPAAETEKVFINAHSIEDQQIKVDGKLDEEVWKRFPPSSGLTQQEPKMGEK
jgi:hypothetical protein